MKFNWKALFNHEMAVPDGTIREVAEEIVAQEVDQQLVEETDPDIGWEGHPCELPANVGLTHMGLTWCCPVCERRWRLEGIEIPTSKHHRQIHRWAEQMSGAPVSDEEIKKLLEESDDAA